VTADLFELDPDIPDRDIPDRDRDTAEGDDSSPRLRLLGGRCRVCGHTFFPRGPVCPYSGDEEVDEIVLPPTGTLWGWTAVTAAPPGYSGPIPYGMGVVELDDGLRVVGRLTVSDPAALRFGQPMTTVATVIPTDGDPLTMWAFEPVGVGA